MTAEIIEFDKKVLKCSFCGKTLKKDEVHLDNGQGNIICSKCIEKCKELLK